MTHLFPASKKDRDKHGGESIPAGLESFVETTEWHSWKMPSHWVPQWLR